MALIKGSALPDNPGHAVRLDFGDLAKRASLMRETATSEAERILRDARAERDRILDGAAAQGHEQGYQAGLDAGRRAGREEAIAAFEEQLKSTEQVWTNMLKDFHEAREALLTESRLAVIELAVAIAQRVVHRAIQLDATIVEDQMRDMLRLVAAPATLIVRIHPDDEELVREAIPIIRSELPGGIHVRLVTDSSMSRGSCIARTLGGASIDASLETQLDRIVHDLLPDRSAEPGPGQADDAHEPQSREDRDDDESPEMRP